MRRLPQVLAHYRLTAPLIDDSLAGAPIVYRNYPNGLDKSGVFHITDVPLSPNKLLWLIHAKYAIEFYTWAPDAHDEDRLRFARVLLEPPSGVSFERVKLAALALRALLFETQKFEAIAMLDGGRGVALWIPFADAPHALELRRWLNDFANRAAALHPDLISTEFNTHADGRVHVHVSSNAARHYSAVPYSLRAQGLTVCTPIRWEELGSFASADAVRASDIPKRLRELGDVFARELSPIAAQRFDNRVQMRTTPEPRGHIIVAAIEILGDGKARDAKELLQEALARKLVPANTTYHYIYTALIEYIARQLGRGRKPPIVQDEQRRFRINEPLDDWPDLVSPAATLGGRRCPGTLRPARIDRQRRRSGRVRGRRLRRVRASGLSHATFGRARPTRRRRRRDPRPARLPRPIGVQDGTPHRHAARCSGIGEVS